MSLNEHVRTRGLAYAKRLREFSPPVSAVGIGGSLGRREEDTHSDVDLFVFFDAGDVFEHARWFTGTSVVGAATLSAGSPKFFAGFGLCVSFVLADLSKIEFFLNTPRTWSEDPMRANTQIVWDTSGRYTDLVTKSSRSDAYARAEISAKTSALHDLVLESLNLAKYAHRGDLWSMHYRIAIVRRILVAFLVCSCPGAEFGIQNAMARTSLLGTPAREELGRSLAMVDPQSMADSLRALAALADRAAKLQARADARWDVVRDTLARAAGVLNG